jgi:GNAT superfamily N-acetyltransferase
MVDPTRHGQGLGKSLLEFRLDRLRANLHISRVCIDSSQLTAPFYEKYGFTTQRIIPDGYAKGLHRHEMELRFTV